MSTPTQLKLLTLLNVSASKRPLDVDVPGGDRSAHALRRSNSSSVESPAEPQAKRVKKGVVFGGEIGPSGASLLGKGKGKSNGKTKAAEAAADAVDIPAGGADSGPGLDVDVEEESESEDERADGKFAAGM